MYRMIVSDSALKDLNRLPRTYQRLVLDRITSLCQNPRPHGVKKLHKIGGFYRVRQGPYRIIYEIDDIRSEITVERIKPRKEAYR